MAVTFRARSTGRTITVTEPDDKPRGMRKSRADHIARLDASAEWERVEPEKKGKPKAGADDSASAEPKP
jgi:hypothetical protein